MKKVKGYIFSRSFMGERIPQHIQNIIIRDYCKKNELQYLLSTSEYNMNNSFLILNDLVTNLKGIDGIIAYSLFQLPYYQGERNKILKKIKFPKTHLDQLDHFRPNKSIFGQIWLFPSGKVSILRHTQSL